MELAKIRPETEEPAPLPDNVVPIRKLGFLAYAQTIQTLPDNVYLLPRTPSLDPETA